MRLINIDQIKPASDAVQSAYAAWVDAGQHEGRLRINRPSDAGGIQRAVKAKDQAKNRYDQALIALATTTHQVITRAERELP